MAALPPVSFMILDMDSGNAVSFFETQTEGERALRRIVAARPEDEWMDLVLIGSDKLGKSVSRTLASSLRERVPEVRVLTADENDHAVPITALRSRVRKILRRAGQVSGDLVRH